MTNLVSGENRLDAQLTAVAVPPVIAVLFGIVRNASTGEPISGTKVMYDGQSVLTNVAGGYSIYAQVAKSISIAFSHAAYYPYQTTITLNPGNNILDVNLKRAITGQMSLVQGYNMVTYSGAAMTVNDAFASIAPLVRRVYHFVNSEYYEDICRSPVGVTTMMIPGDNYWVAVDAACLWTF